MLQRNHAGPKGLMGVFFFVWLAGLVVSPATAAPAKSTRWKGDLQKILAEKSIQPSDLLCQGDLKQLFQRLEEKGHPIDQKDQLVAAALPDGHFLVRLSRTPAGQRYFKKVANLKLIYDRLDRVSQQPGGQRLLKDLVKLPDAEKYSRARTPNGVPTLLDLLPKQRSGKTRTIRDYYKPTGKIYTAQDLVKRLEQLPNPQTPNPQTPNPKTPNPKTPNPKTPNPKTPNARTPRPR